MAEAAAALIAESAALELIAPPPLLATGAANTAMRDHFISQ